MDRKYREGSPRGVRPWLLAARVPRTTLAALTLMLLAALAGATAGSAQPVPSLTIRFLDAGDGDATLIALPNGEAALVDCGPSSFGKQLVLQLQAAGVDRVERLVMTHTHAHAIGGCSDILQHLTVGRILWGGQRDDSLAWRSFESVIGMYGVPMDRPVAPGWPSDWGGATMTVFQAEPDGSVDDEYDTSLVLLAEYGGWRTLLPGHIHAAGESSALRQGLGAPVHFVKAADRGSAEASTAGFLSSIFQLDLGTTSCHLAVISRGPQTRAAIAPTPARDRLESTCQQVLSTAENGTIAIRVPADGSMPRLCAERALPCQ